MPIIATKQAALPRKESSFMMLKLMVNVVFTNWIVTNQCEYISFKGGRFRLGPLTLLAKT